MTRVTKTIKLSSEPHLKILREVVAGSLRIVHRQKDHELAIILSEIITEIDNAETYWPDDRTDPFF